MQMYSKLMWGGLLGIVAVPAHAYIDPATGSMLLQGIIAGVAGAAVAIKFYWQKLKSVFQARKSDDQSLLTTDNDSAGNDKSGH